MNSAFYNEMGNDDQFRNYSNYKSIFTYLKDKVFFCRYINHIGRYKYEMKNVCESVNKSVN